MPTFQQKMKQRHRKCNPYTVLKKKAHNKTVSEGQRLQISNCNNVQRTKGKMSK